MSFEGIEQVVTVEDYTSANQYLEKGWELLAISPGANHPSVREGVYYTLGRRARKQPPLMPTASDLARANSGL